MKGLLLTKYKELEVAEMPKPEIGPNDVLVSVRACGICGSDVHGYDGSTGRRIPPLVMGHEAAGVIAEAGRNVKDWKVGDRVTFDSTVSCGHCYFCRRGDINLCDNRQVLGVSCGDYRRNGAFAEFVSVPQNILYRLPDALSFDHAAMIEAVSIAVHAVNLTPRSLGDTAVVVGSGMIGQLTIQAAKVAGFGRVFAIDVDDAKLERAKGLGADETFNSKNCDVVAGDCGADGRRRGGRGARSGRGDRSDSHGDRGGAQGRRGDADRQPRSEDRAAAAGGGDAADSAARVVRVVGRVSGLHRAAFFGEDSRRFDDQRADFAR